MQLGVHESRQTAVEFLGVTDYARGSVQHSLQPVCNELRRPGENYYYCTISLCGSLIMHLTIKLTGYIEHP